MSEVDARAPTRGRSSTRGGRGSFARGGPRGGRKQDNGTSTDTAQIDELLEDQGELGELKKQYSSELGMLKDMFPDWTDVDLVLALQETNGDIPNCVDRITQGNVSQFSEVKKTKDRARSRAKDDTAMAGASDRGTPGARGGRGRGGFESSRGRGGRGTDRGRGAYRGGRGGHATTNGAPKDFAGVSVPTTESSAWDTPVIPETAADSTDDWATEATKDAGDAGQSAWGNVVTAEATPAAASEGAKSSLIPEGGPKKSWASMFSQPPPAPAPKPTQQAQPPPAELLAQGEVPAAEETPAEPVAEAEPESQPEPAAPIEEEAAVPEVVETPPVQTPVTEPTSATEPAEMTLAPSQAPLTEENVEHLPDSTEGPSTLTAASTIGSTDTRNLTPLPTMPTPIGRPPVGGFATSAYRAAGVAGRSASYQRRVQEQQEAVVMPGHNAVDRAAVQFGSMGINGEPGLDIDDEREEPETRQAPQHSPPSQPKASLPPAPRQTLAQEPSAPDGLPTPKQAPGLPPASQQNQQHFQDAAIGQEAAQEPVSMAQHYNQYGNYGQAGMQQDSSAAQQKPYDPFGHQAQQGQYDRYGVHQSQQHQTPSGFGGLSSAPTDYSSYYTSEPQRNAYGYYGTSAGYAPQEVRNQPQQQEAGLGQQRSASSFGAGPNETAYGSQAQQQAQSRYGEAPGSGHNTPNPLMGGAQQQPQHQQQQAGPTAQSAQSMHQHGPTQQQQQAQAAFNASFPYGHPYYNSPYQQAYQNQFGFSHQLGAYGSGYPSKQQQQQQQGSMYGAPQGYGQSSYEQHAASPANTAAFGQNQQSSMRNVSGMGSNLGGSGLDDYGRSTAQTASQQQNSGFGGMNDPFARSASGFGGQGGYGQQQSVGTGVPGQDDSLKPFNDNKNGPSPALGQPGRPGSATNSAAGSTQTGLPPPQQSQHSAFGGYPGFPGQGSQYGGLGSLGGHQQHQQPAQQQQQQQGQSAMGGQQQQGGYGGYGAGGFGQTYGSYGAARGGWGQSYGAH